MRRTRGRRGYGRVAAVGLPSPSARPRALVSLGVRVGWVVGEMVLVRVEALEDVARAPRERLVGAEAPKILEGMTTEWFLWSFIF